MEGTARKWKDVGLICLLFSNLCVYLLYLVFGPSAVYHGDC